MTGAERVLPRRRLPFYSFVVCLRATDAFIHLLVHDNVTQRRWVVPRCSASLSVSQRYAVGWVPLNVIMGCYRTDQLLCSPTRAVVGAAWLVLFLRPASLSTAAFFVLLFHDRLPSPPPTPISKPPEASARCCRCRKGDQQNRAHGGFM